MIQLDQGGLGAGAALPVPVPPALHPVVEELWVLPQGPLGTARSWRVVADPNPHVLLHRHLDGRVRFSVVGARSRYVDVDRDDRAFTVAARLAVGALPLFTGHPATDFLDTGVHVADLFGAEGRTTIEQARQAVTPAQAVKVMARLLRRRLGDGSVVDWRIRGLMAHVRRNPGGRLSDAAALMGISSRALRTHARGQVGLGPKEVQRVYRLLRSLRTMRRGASGAEAALAAGLTDQAHLSHECVAFLGEPPGRFLARGAPPFSTRRAASSSLD